jgi:hypothetical protein
VIGGQKGKEYLDDLAVDGIIILKQILNKNFGKDVNWIS